MPERKITLNVPEELLEAAQRTSGQGVTETVRQGLRLVAAGETFRRVAKLRGTVKFSREPEKAAGRSLMVAADTSSMVAFLQEGEGDDVEVIQSALEHQQSGVAASGADRTPERAGAAADGSFAAGRAAATRY